MKQRKKASIIFAAGMLLLAGCQKDDLQGRGERMMLNLEAFGSGSKTVLGADDRSLQWLSGDQVRINGVDYTVSTSGDEAYVSDVLEASTYKALFPASMAAERDMSAATLPRQYEYRTEGGLQVLDAPLAAVGDGSGGLTFRHLTGALTVVIKNTTSNTLYIDSVVLSSAQQLCGDITVDFDNLTAVSPNTSPSNPEDTMVLLTVPYNTLSVAAGAEVKVQIPVLPVSDANRFTVHVATRYQGTRYDFDRRQGATSNALARNEMGYVPASIATSGTHISVLPLFKYNESQWTDLLYAVEIYSPLDFLLLADAVNNEWAIPAPFNANYDGVTMYKEVNYIYFKGNIDMEGCTIPQLNWSGGNSGNRSLAVGGGTINNLTINGNSLFKSPYTEGFQFYTDITFNNLTFNVPVGENNTAVFSEYFDTGDGYMSNVHVNGLTFNISNNSSNRNMSICGLAGEVNDWAYVENCSVTDIAVNVTGTPLKNISFSGIGGVFFSNSNDGMGLPKESSCTYIQNKPLILQATGMIVYGGFCAEAQAFGMDGNDIIPFVMSGTITHNVTLDAPNVVVGGMLGVYRYESSDTFSSVSLCNSPNTVTQSGYIRVNASSSVRGSKKICLAVPVMEDLSNLSHESDIIYENGTFNDDALTLDL